MSLWQPIATAPKDGREVMLWREDWPCPIFASWNDDYDEPFWQASEEVLSDIMGAVDEPSHWCHFEAPPK